MSPPTPPLPPIISRQGLEEEEQRIKSRSHHRTARDYRASRSRSRGREQRYRQRTHSRSRSRDASRYRRRPSPSRHRERSLSRHRRDRSLSQIRRERSLSRHRRERSASRRRHERSRSRSRGRTERRRRSSYKSRSRSYSRTNKSSVHRSKSRSHSRSRRRSQRSRSGSKSLSVQSSRRKRRDDRGESSKQANVIVLSTETYKDSLKSQSRLPSVREEPSTSSLSGVTKPADNTPSWKKAKIDQIGVYSNLEPDAPIDKEKIHKEIEEKLRLVLAREGKVYPYPKPEPSHPVFANDGSFLEIFKKMQQQQTFVQQQVGETMQIHAVPAAPVPKVMPVPTNQPPPPPQLPIFGRRRGGKILKTGVVAKPKSSNDTDSGDVKDFWSIYLREVKKYKSTACESESKTRPLVR